MGGERQRGRLIMMRERVRVIEKRERDKEGRGSEFDACL